MRSIIALVASGLLVAAAGTPAAIASPDPTAQQCEVAWFEYQYADIAPGFPTTMSASERQATVKVCGSLNLLPSQDRKLLLTQEALNAAAQILERRIWRVSVQRDIRPCLAAEEVLKPVGAYGKPIGPKDNVMGYARNSYLPILRYNWWSGPFRLQFIGGCVGRPFMNLWFYVDPYPPNADRPGLYPSPESVKKNPWNRTPVEGRMSTCITWGPGLDNDQVGQRGVIFSFDWSKISQRSWMCYSLAAAGIDRSPFTKIPTLP